MKKLKFLTALSSVACTLIAGAAIAKTTIYTNVNGYTLVGGELHKFTHIQFTDDIIDKTFSSLDKQHLPKDAEIIDGHGKTMLPGLIDAHGHILSYGLSLLRADLSASFSAQDAVQRTLKYAETNPEIRWVQGRGWNQELWPNKTFPTAKMLDRFFPDKAVWLRRVDGHAGWANSKAMQLASISKTTQSPDGGEIIKDKHGMPTGIFVDNAMSLIENKIPPLTQKEQRIALTKAMNSLASLGITSVHDAGIDSRNLALFEQLAKEELLPIRVNAMLYLPSPNWQQRLTKGTFVTPDNKLQFNSVKIQADGALGSRGAALINDYSDQHGHKGLLLHSADDLQRYVAFAMQKGFQVNTHAIGDDANAKVLDLYQSLIENTNSKHLRHRVEHAQVLRLSDIPRFNELGIIASMQATHATSDKNMAQDRLGKERIQGAYAWRKLLEANAIIAAGSDFPVEPANPFYGLHASVTRQDRKNAPENGWMPEEKMTRVEALRTFTSDAAYSGHQEHILGELTSGKKADFILIDHDYFTVNEEDLWNLQVAETWVDGQRVFKR